MHEWFFIFLGLLGILIMYIIAFKTDFFLHQLDIWL